jgi:hypothetical protein
MITDPSQLVGIAGAVACTVRLGDITSISIHNDQGGTGFLPAGTYHATVIRAWDDPETGWRAIGVLTDRHELEISRRAGTTGFPARARLLPYVMFALDDFTPEEVR